MRGLQWIESKQDLTGLSPNVPAKPVGFVPEDELPRWYAACDLFLSADRADHDLTIMAALVELKRIVASTQYDVFVRTGQASLLLPSGGSQSGIVCTGDGAGARSSPMRLATSPISRSCNR